MGEYISPDMGVALSESSSHSTDAGAAATGTDQGSGGTQQAGSSAEQGQQSSGDADKGFPENTPVAQMSDAQKAAYYRFQNRQTDNKLSAFKGVKPEDVTSMQQELENLRNEKLSADQKAVKEAEKAARSAADADWLPKLQTAQLRAIASDVLKGDQLNAWLDGMNPAKFAGANGEVDEEKVMGHLTAAFGVGGNQGQQSGNGQQQQHRSWGQHSGGTTGPVKPGAAGQAEAAKRFGAKTT